MSTIRMKNIKIIQSDWLNSNKLKERTFDNNLMTRKHDLNCMNGVHLLLFCNKVIVQQLTFLSNGAGRNAIN